MVGQPMAAYACMAKRDFAGRGGVCVAGRQKRKAPSSTAAAAAAAGGVSFFLLEGGALFYV